MDVAATSAPADNARRSRIAARPGPMTTFLPESSRLYDQVVDAAAFEASMTGQRRQVGPERPTPAG